ncbi:MAG: hypothetical protein IPI01_21000 [Ignavibacteriae bacterium]|nr:hypothetical protein [Ignavibacteriota bacterium]
MNVSISFTGPYECTNLPLVVRVFDPQGAFGTDTLFLTVAAPDQPPVILAIADTVVVPGQPFGLPMFAHN